MSFGLYPFAKKTGRVPKRSPIRRRPLRVAGQSLDETIQRVLQEDTYETLGVVVVFVSLAIWEWFRVLYRRVCGEHWGGRQASPRAQDHTERTARA